MVNKVLLKVRSMIKKRKPIFRRQQWNQFAKIKNKVTNWRRPKGHQSKLRLRKKGHPKMPTVGYSSPKKVRGLNKEGFKEILVYNVNDLVKIDVKKEVAVIGSTVGMRKRLEILKKAKNLGVSFTNLKDIDKKINEIESLINNKKKKSENKKEEKKKGSKKSSKRESSSKGNSKKSSSPKNNDSSKKDNGGSEE